MITRVLILECDYCPRSTRIKGGEVTEARLIERAAGRGWTRTPLPNYSDMLVDRCPKCVKVAKQ